MGSYQHRLVVLDTQNGGLLEIVQFKGILFVRLFDFFGDVDLEVFVVHPNLGDGLESAIVGELLLDDVGGDVGGILEVLKVAILVLWVQKGVLL